MKEYAMAQCMPYSGKFSIVTGASGGIGLELAKCCAQDGYDLLIAAESPGSRNSTARTLRRARRSIDGGQDGIPAR